MQLQQVARCPLPAARCQLQVGRVKSIHIRTADSCRLSIAAAAASVVVSGRLADWGLWLCRARANRNRQGLSKTDSESESPIKCISRWVYWISDQTKRTAKAFDFSASLSDTRFGYAFDFEFVCTPSHCSPTDSRDHLGVRDRETDWETALAANTNATPAAVEGCSKL